MAAAAGVTRLVFGTLDYALDLDLDIAEGSDGLAYAASRHGDRVACRRARGTGGRRHAADSTTRRACWPTWPGRAATASAPSCASTRSRSPPIHAALAPSPQDARLGAPRARRRSGVARRRPARRPDDRPSRRAAGAAHAAPRRLLNPSIHFEREHTMASTIIDSAIFQGIFSSDAMREVWSDENRTQKYLDIEARAGQGAGPPRPDPAGGGRRDRQPLPARRRSTWASCASRPSASATRSSAWSRSSTCCAATSSASTATGARPRRTSPTPRRCCRSAKALAIVDARAGGDLGGDGQARARSTATRR